MESLILALASITLGMQIANFISVFIEYRAFKKEEKKEKMKNEGKECEKTRRGNRNQKIEKGD